MDYQESSQMFFQAVQEAQDVASVSGYELHYDCVSYEAINSVLTQIYGENIPKDLLEQSWDGELDIITHAATQGWEVIEIGAIGCPEHYGDGRAFLVRKSPTTEIEEYYSSIEYCPVCGGTEDCDCEECFEIESREQNDKTGWTGWTSCGCTSCTNPGKSPQQGITAPDGTEFSWGDGISRTADEDAREFVMNFFGCDEDTACDFISDVQGEARHEDWD